MRACMLFIRGMGGRWGFEDAGGVLICWDFSCGVGKVHGWFGVRSSREDTHMQV